LHNQRWLSLRYKKCNSL